VAAEDGENFEDEQIGRGDRPLARQQSLHVVCRLLASKGVDDGGAVDDGHCRGRAGGAPRPRSAPSGERYPGLECVP
jgi:hypothetical protein